MSKLVRSNIENKVWMNVLCEVREHMEHALTKHGEPSLQSAKTVNALKEEFEEVVGEVIGTHDVVNEEMEREIRDLVAFGLIVLHRGKLRREEWERITRKPGTSASAANQS